MRTIIKNIAEEKRSRAKSLLVQGDKYAEDARNMSIDYAKSKELYKKAVDFYSQAVETDPDYDYARYVAAFTLCFNLGDDKTYNEAIKIALPAAERGYDEAQYVAGMCYFKLNNYGEKEELYNNAFKWFLAAAKQNHQSSNYYVGWCYENQLGTTQDFTSAVKYYNIAANEGNGTSLAMARLGSLYARGLGVTRDISKALEWYEAARRKNYGIPYADFVMRNLIIMDSSKRKIAFEIYRRELDRYGSSNSVSAGLLLMLIFCYGQGIGTERSCEIANELIHRNSQLKDISHLIPKLKSITIGEFEWNLPINVLKQLSNDTWWKKDYEMYLHWNLLLAEVHNDPEGELMAAHCFRDGRGVRIDNNKAIELYKKAATSNTSFASIARRILLEKFNIHV